MSETEKSNLDESTVPFFPDHIGLEAKVALVFGIFVIIVGLFGLFYPVGLQAAADPMDTPAHVKPEWYFLALYQLLKFIPKTAGVLLPIFAVILAFIWPFIDRKEDSIKQTQIRWIFSIVFTILLIAGTIWGWVS